MAPEEADCLAVEPLVAIGERVLFGAGEVARLVLASRAAPARIVAPQFGARRSDEPPARGDLDRIGVLEFRPPSERRDGVAALERIPAPTIEQEPEPMGRGEGGFEVFARRTGITGAFLDHAGQPLGAHLLNLVAGSVDRRRRDDPRRRHLVLTRIVGLDELVEHGDGDGRLLARHHPDERSAYCDGVVVRRERLDVLRGKWGVLLAHDRLDARHPLPVRLLGPLRLVRRHVGPTDLEPRGLTQFGQRTAGNGERVGVRERDGEDDLLEGHRYVSEQLGHRVAHELDDRRVVVEVGRRRRHEHHTVGIDGDRHEGLDVTRLGVTAEPTQPAVWPEPGDLLGRERFHAHGRAVGRRQLVATRERGQIPADPDEGVQLLLDAIEPVGEREALGEGRQVHDAATGQLPEQHAERDLVLDDPLDRHHRKRARGADPFAHRLHGPFTTRPLQFGEAMEFAEHDRNGRQRQRGEVVPILVLRERGLAVEGATQGSEEHHRHLFDDIDPIETCCLEPLSGLPHARRLLFEDLRRERSANGCPHLVHVLAIAGAGPEFGEEELTHLHVGGDVDLRIRLAEEELELAEGHASHGIWGVTRCETARAAHRGRHRIPQSRRPVRRTPPRVPRRSGRP